MSDGRVVKKKAIVIAVIAALAAVLVIAGILIGVALRQKEEFDFVINDTLPDGGGKPARVILLGGQSNASGCSRDDYLKMNVSPEQYAEYERGYDNVYINYYVSGNHESQEFVRCGARQGEAGGHFGPELGLADKLNELYPDETIFIIKCAWGGTNLYEQWLSPSSRGKTGELYQHFTAYVKESLEYLESKNYDVSVEAMCWMQGESDSFKDFHAEDYEKHLTSFIKDIRKEFKGYASDDGIAFIDAYIADNSVYWVHCDIINAAKANVAEKSPINVVVDTVAAGLVCSGEPQPTPDMAHYDSLSEIKLGHMFAEEAARFFD